jgi:NSS family neurotransmitter:Na+ symporter
MLAAPWPMAFWMLGVVGISFAICGAGLRGGVERVTKLMMGALFALMLALAVRAMLLPGARAGLAFYLLPDFGRMREAGLTEVVFAAMGQAFFTLSLGIGSMAVFGSYIGRERSLTGETVNIVLLDTCVAVASGLIIFPACFAFGVKPDAGPGLRAGACGGRSSSRS